MGSKTPLNIFNHKIAYDGKIVQVNAAKIKVRSMQQIRGAQ